MRRALASSPFGSARYGLQAASFRVYRGTPSAPTSRCTSFMVVKRWSVSTSSDLGRPGGMRFVDTDQSFEPGNSGNVPSDMTSAASALKPPVNTARRRISCRSRSSRELLGCAEDDMAGSLSLDARRFRREYSDDSRELTLKVTTF